MQEFAIDIAAESPCNECGTIVPLDVSSCPSCQGNTHRLGFDTFFADLDHMRMMDARHGGLVLGRGGPEDDIPMYLYAGKGFFELAGLMQGGEYLLSRAASISHGALLEEINSEKGEAKDESHAFSAFSSVINTNFMPEFGGLWIRRQQFIVNRFATQKHFATLEKINAEANWGGAKG